MVDGGRRVAMIRDVVIEHRPPACSAAPGLGKPEPLPMSTPLPKNAPQDGLRAR